MHFYFELHKVLHAYVYGPQLYNDTTLCVDVPNRPMLAKMQF